MGGAGALRVVVETAEGWALPLAGLEVTRCFVESAGFGLLVLDADTSATIHVGDFVLSRGAEMVGIDGSSPDGAARALHLLGKQVKEATIDRNGVLDLRFSDGWAIRATPGDYENFEIEGPGDLMVVSPAGGTEPAIWGTAYERRI